MFRKRNNLLLIVLFLAVLTFVFISVGGEFLHSYLHDHKDQESRNQCPISQIQAQVFVAFFIAFVALLLKAAPYVEVSYDVFVIKPHQITPFSHAPPVSL